MKKVQLCLAIAACSFFYIQSTLGQTIAKVDLHDVQPVETSTKKTPKKPAVKAVPNFELGLQEASFTGLETFVAEHLQYPELAKKNAIEGTVHVLVVISPDGKVTNPKVVSSLGFGCDEAALELINKMPRWNPASNYGIRVQDKHLLEFQFKLQ
jgi:TonB family protein